MDQDAGPSSKELIPPVAARTAADIQPPALPPDFKQALTQHVRFAGGELPLWGVLAPIATVLIMATAVMAGAATAREVMVQAPAPSASVVPAAPETSSASAPAPSAAPAVAPPVESSQVAPAPKPLTLLQRAANGDAQALAELEKKAPADLAAEEALAIADGHASRALAAAEELSEKLLLDPALIKNQKTVTSLYDMTQDPVTGREALAAMAALPGPLGADMLYEIWTGTPTKNETTELARLLLMGKTVRAKASPALSVALELRTTEDCAALLSAMPRAVEQGDKRSFGVLSRLQRKSGCGPAKRVDCYPCLRKGTELKEALAAVRQRREPEPFKP